MIGSVDCSFCGQHRQHLCACVHRGLAERGPRNARSRSLPETCSMAQEHYDRDYPQSIRFGEQPDQAPRQHLLLAFRAGSDGRLFGHYDCLKLSTRALQSHMFYKILQNSLQKSTESPTKVYRILYKSPQNSLQKPTEFSTKVYRILYKSLHNSPQFYTILYKTLHNSLQKSTKAYRILYKSLQNPLQKSTESFTKVYRILYKSRTEFSTKSTVFSTKVYSPQFYTKSTGFSTEV